MKVLGIDPGTRVTGYGVVENGRNGRLIHVCDGEIRGNPRDGLPERLLKISDSVKKVMEEFSPDCVSVESVFFGPNVRSAVALSHARGVILLAAAGCGVKIFEYGATRIKQAVTGYGGATKEQVQKMVSMLLKTGEKRSPDASDALAAAICHIHHSCGLSAALLRHDGRGFPRERKER
ncbi:MAG: crossover junction endodeoxyribonuclease RuvC [Deltaproteobacteria bacterium]|nr:crossover junction endodeoxyribonuclease RuvC [Deltaproteobacteria bacterium]